MQKPSLGPSDRLFVAALVVQVVVAAILGTAIVRAIDRAGPVAQVAVAPTGPGGPASLTPSALPTGRTSTTTTTTTTTTGGGGGPGDITVGITGGEIKVGGIFTLSGPADATPALHAAQAYFNVVNAAGGVFGRKIRYITRDDHFDQSIGYAAVKDLVENQKVFAMAAWVAPNTENQQTVDYLGRGGVPLVGNFGQPPEYTSPISYSFALSWNWSPPLSIRTIAKMLGQKKIGLVWVHLTNEIDNIIVKGATEEAKRNGAEIVYREPADVTKLTYDDTVSAARDAGATGMVTIMDAYSLARYWNSFARTTWRPTQVGYAFAMDPQPTKAIPAGYTDVHAIQEMELPSNHTPPVDEYLNAMKRYYPEDTDKLSWASELSWLGAKMFVEALRRAGPNPTRKGILNALDTMTNFNSGLAPPYTLRPGPHDFVKCVKAAKLTASRTWAQESDWFCM